MKLIVVFLKMNILYFMNYKNC